MQFLVVQWACGLMSAPLIQKIAELAVGDHLDSNGAKQSPLSLIWLSTIGTSGKNDQHCHRDLVRFLQNTRRAAPKLSNFQLPLLSRKRDRHGERIEGDRTFAFLNPALWLHYLYSSWPNWFGRQFLGGGIANVGESGARLRSYWATIPDADPRKRAIAEAHRNDEGLRSEDDIWSRAIPIQFHGDAFPCSRTSVDTMSWGGFWHDASLRTAPTLDISSTL